MYLVTFSKQADKDKKLLKSVGLDKKTKDLLNIISVNPFQNPPPYEKLLGNLSNHYSRRINVQHRLVYKIETNDEGLKSKNGDEYEGIVFVKRMWTHYE
jgi:Txe/YoeB family toxin of toxin-antitoxin system